MKNVLIVIVCNLILACNTPVPKDNSDKKDTQKQANKMQSLPVTIEELTKRCLEESVKEYGQPLQTESFILDDALPESRIELNNYFTVKERRSESITIKEVIWEKDQETNIRVWYREVDNKWSVVHAVEWTKGAEF
ncbi:hypothetical protein [Sinomicrobium sp.]